MVGKYDNKEGGLTNLDTRSLGFGDIREGPTLQRLTLQRLGVIDTM